MNSIECNNYGAVAFIEEIIKTLAFCELDNLKINLQHNNLLLSYILDDVIMIVKKRSFSFHAK